MAKNGVIWAMKGFSILYLLTRLAGCACPDDEEKERVKKNPPPPPSINHPPQVLSSPGLEAVINIPYEYDINAVDPDGDALTYVLKDAPDSMSIDQKTGVVTWTPQYKDIGEKSVLIQVSDGKENTLQSFLLTVFYPDRQNYFYAEGNERYIVLCDLSCAYTKEQLDKRLEGLMVGDAAVLQTTGGVDTPESRRPIEVRFFPDGGGSAHDLLPDGRGEMILYGQDPSITVEPIVDNQTMPMHELTHLILLGLINEYSPRYASVPFAGEESFPLNMSLLISHMAGTRPDISSFSDSQLSTMMNSLTYFGAKPALLNNLASSYGIDAPQMPWLFAEIVSARAQKGSVLNLWDLYQVTNVMASRIAGQPTDTIDAYHACNLTPETFPH